MDIARRTLGPLYRALPVRLRREIRTRRLESIVRSGKFVSDEYEFGRLHEWLQPGDVAIDIGANCGTYTLRMSQLVGNGGQVFAFEPVPQTFAILTRLLAVSDCTNVTALNLACSSRNGMASISVPDEAVTGEDLYRASLLTSEASSLSICCVRLDDVALPLERLRLVKIDVERHETEVIDGMWNVICSRRPIMIIENLPPPAADRLIAIGYRRVHKARSPNSVFLPDGPDTVEFD
jgi:FkbM family methyltransferase